MEEKIGDDKNLKKEYNQWLEKLDDKKSIGEILNIDKSIEKNPFFSDLVKNSRINDLLRLTPLKNKEQEIDKFIDTLNQFSGYRPDFWEKLIKEKIVKSDEIEDIKLTVTLDAISLGNIKLVDELKKEGVKSLKDLINYRRDDWISLFKNKEIDPPDIIKKNLNIDNYTNFLVESLADKFPTAVFFSQIGKEIEEDNYNRVISNVYKFLKKNPNITLKDITRPDKNNIKLFKDLSDEDKDKIKLDIKDLKKITKIYSHMGIEQIISDSNKETNEKLTDINKKIEQLNTFLKINPDFDLNHCDLFQDYCSTKIQKKEEKTKINWQGFEDKDRKKISAQLKTYQRLFRIYPRYEVVKSLLISDFDSARKISLIPEEKFVNQYISKTNSEKKLATTLYKKALGITENTTLQWVNIKDTIESPHYRGATFCNMRDDFENYYKELESYQDMFGSLNFCECEDCKSLFSPAAYFVDLMRFIEVYITQNEINSIPSHRTLYLREVSNPEEFKGRRPDLWEIPLDCKNTNTEIPYIDIVNEVLERNLGGKDDKTIPYKKLLEAKHPFDLPFNLPLEQIRIYLEHFEKKLSEIYEVFNLEALKAKVSAAKINHQANPTVDTQNALDEANSQLKVSMVNIGRENLHISKEELSILTKSTNNYNDLKEFYGVGNIIDFQVPSFGELYKVQTFLHHVGLSRKELSDLLFQNLSKSEIIDKLNKDFFINSNEFPIKIEIDNTDPENNFEKLANLSIKKMDRLHRFIRLSKKIDMSFEDLDWVLRSIDKTNHDKDLDEDAFINIALIKKWQKKYNLSSEIICSFWYNIKNIGKKNPDGPEPQDLFSRIFNNPDILLGTEPYDPYHNPVEFNLNDPSDDRRNWLLAALEIYDEDLSIIVEQLTDGINKIELNHNNLSRLYRFSKIAKILDITVRELVLILDLTGMKEISKINEFDLTERTTDWINKSDLNIYELHYILSGKLNEFVDIGYTINEIVPLTENLTSALIEIEKKEIEEELADGKKLLRLLNEEEVKKEKTNSIFENLELIFDKNPAFMKSIIEFALQSLDDPTLLTELFTKITLNDPIPINLDNFLRNIHQRVFLVNKLNLKQSEVDSFKNPTEKKFYLIEDPASLKISDVKKIMEFKELIKSFNDNEDKLIQYFRQDTADDGSDIRNEKSEILETITLWGKKTIKDLIDHFWQIPLPGKNSGYNNINGILKLKNSFDLNSYMGVSIDILLEWSKTVDGDWDLYHKISKSVLEILKAKYDEDEWEDIYEPFHNKVRKIKRDSLSSYAIWNIDKDWPRNASQIKNLRDLYEYLLIDVEMTSCQTISKIKEGLNSLQLFIQRCQMNLEDGIKSESVPKEIWAWMKNYRVWEANRKVFLYPENYIYPELRDDKSPEFKELEGEILQGEITDENVEKAYKNYLDKISTLAQLKIAGNYYDAGTKTLFLFARTNTEPYIYYYREMKCKYETEATWTPWEKVNCSIKSEFVSPIYAFKRLFLFWKEITKNKFADDSGSPYGTGFNIHFKHINKYSFYNFNKEWVTPQTIQWKSAAGKIENSQSHSFVEYYPGDPYPIGTEEYYPYYYVVYPNFQQNEIIFAVLKQRVKLDKNLKVSPLDEYEYEEKKLDILFSNNKELTRWRKLSSSLQILPNYYESASFNSASFPEDFTERDIKLAVILRNSSIDATVKVINNNSKPTWFIFDNGDEEFLVKNLFKTVLWNEDLGSVESVPGYFWREIPASFELVPESNNITVEILPSNQSPVSSFERLTTSCVRDLSQILLSGGVDKLLKIKTQQETSELDFSRLHPENYYIKAPYPKSGGIDFEGPYGLYYREIFFHIPFLIANQLNKDQKFEEAQKWYHYIYNPTISEAEPDTSYEDLVWQYLPFRGLNLEMLEEMLRDPDALEKYHTDPFKPHVIARLRLNTYQKTIIMKYIDNLIDWGDIKFSQYSWESLTEATMLYVLAYNILGPRPENLAKCETSEPMTYQEIENLLSSDSEFLIELENTQIVESAGRGTPNLNLDVPLYFCVPENEDFVNYWNRVEEQLYKIRHCMTIEGVKAELSLFQPPIDPMALVRAAAAGIDIGSLLLDLGRPLPYYRFTYILEKAKNLTSAVQQLGSTLLSILEKKDAEELVLLRSTHEKNILHLTTTIKEKQEEEINESHVALQESKKNAEKRNSHYKDLIKKGLSTHEKKHLRDFRKAWKFDLKGNIFAINAGIVHLLPNTGAPTAITYGGIQLGSSLSAIAQAYKAYASYYTMSASMSSTRGSNSRRKQEWKLQRDLSQHDIDQIQKQIDASEIRKSIAEKDIIIHKKMVEQTNKVYDFLKEKFSNQELYNWMVTELSGAYFQTYKMAFDLAKSAQKAYQFERNTDETYIDFGHWDSLKKGLLSGERLMLELNQLEKAYLDSNRRPLEIEKTISLALLDALALIDLKEKGWCEFELPELIFDLDFPGHYCRKLKSISISIPVLVGPYENVKATLTQLGSKTILSPDEKAIEYLILAKGNMPDSIRGDWYAQQQIAISKGVNDSGMFELNFRDERYLPFEGTGVVSNWRLEMPKTTNLIDFDSISDIIINLKYTAEFNGTLKDKVIDILNDAQDRNELIPSYFRVVSLRHEFSSAWHQFMNPLLKMKEQSLLFEISDSIRPPNCLEFDIKTILLKAQISSVKLSGTSELKLSLNKRIKPGDQPDDQNGVDFIFNKDNYIIEKPGDFFQLGDWVITINRKDGIPNELKRKKKDEIPEEYDVEDIDGENYYFLDPEKLENLLLLLVCEYKIDW